MKSSLKQNSFRDKSISSYESLSNPEYTICDDTAFTLEITKKKRYGAVTQSSPFNSFG